MGLLSQLLLGINCRHFQLTKYSMLIWLVSWAMQPHVPLHYWFEDNRPVYRQTWKSSRPVWKVEGWDFQPRLKVATKVAEFKRQGPRESKNNWVHRQKIGRSSHHWLVITWIVFWLSPCMSKTMLCVSIIFNCCWVRVWTTALLLTSSIFGRCIQKLSNDMKMSIGRIG